VSIIHITKSNFENEVLNSSVPVLLDFWAPWCGPCRMIGPIVEELSEDLTGKAKVGKINVDEEMELAQAFGVSSIPTLIVMQDGKIVNRAVGLRRKSDLRVMLGV
jgi:thioredoxin 1